MDYGCTVPLDAAAERVRLADTKPARRSALITLKRNALAATEVARIAQGGYERD